MDQSSSSTNDDEGNNNNNNDSAYFEDVLPETKTTQPQIQEQSQSQSQSQLKGRKHQSTDNNKTTNQNNINTKDATKDADENDATTSVTGTIISKKGSPNIHLCCIRRNRLSCFASCYLFLKRFVRAFEIPLVVFCWYLLGVMSISTTKILLRDYGRDIDLTAAGIDNDNTKDANNVNTASSAGHKLGISPLFLTLQQFCFAITFLKLWITIQNKPNPPNIHCSVMDMIYSRYYQQKHKDETQIEYQSKDEMNTTTNTSSSSSSSSEAATHLFKTAICYTLGFYITNKSFNLSDPSFVETIKASEPLATATIASLSGLQTFNCQEVVSLICICGGVVLSTMGKAISKPNAVAVATATAKIVGTTTTSSSMGRSFVLSGIIFLSNVSFSFRGLFQKRFRNTSEGSKEAVDDFYLQYKLHRTGISILCLVVLALDVRYMVDGLKRGFVTLMKFEVSGDGGGGGVRMRFGRYFALSLANGFAYTHYNLASSFVLSRISVVHHAALNCLRRFFAIVVTSIVFRVPIGLVSGLGIMVSVAGFMAFTHFKESKVKKSHPLLPVSK